MSPYEDAMNRDSPDGRRVERNSASIWFPLQGEVVALADRRVVKRRLDQRGAKQDRADDFYRRAVIKALSRQPICQRCPHCRMRFCHQRE
jgi:hypothetical protein